MANDGVFVAAQYNVAAKPTKATNPASVTPWSVSHNINSCNHPVNRTWRC